MHQLTVFESPYKKIRIGRYNDGGYIIADIPNPEYDIFISGGISNDVSFEIAVQKKYDSQFLCLAFDGSISQLPENHKGIQHIKLNITDEENEKSTNLANFFHIYKNMLLKLDIEGGEEFLFKTLTENDLLKIKQLVIEIHDCNSHIPEKMSNTHYLIHVHGNNYGGVPVIDGVPIPNVYEATFVRKDCFISQPNLNTELLPIEGLDQPNGKYRPDGVTLRPEIFLHCKPYCNSNIEHPYVQHAYGSFYL